MSARKIEGPSSLQEQVTVEARQTRLSLSPNSVILHKNGIEFRSATQFAPWTEMTLTLQSRQENRKVNCNGVVISCTGNKHTGYHVSMIFTDLSKQAQARLRQRIQEDREADFSYYIPAIGRFRTNLFQQRGQWCLAMRYVKTHVPSFEELGLLEQIRGIAESPRGIVLVAGSTGCGKSTTLAAMIEHINANFKKHIITMEDPIEYVFEDNQCVVE